jgi:hypothetical protein
LKVSNHTLRKKKEEGIMKSGKNQNPLNINEDYKYKKFVGQLSWACNKAWIPALVTKENMSI